MPDISAYKKLDGTLFSYADMQARKDSSAAKEAINSANEVQKTKMLLSWTSGGISVNDGTQTSNTKRGRTSFFKLIKGATYIITPGYEFIAFEYNLSNSTPTYLGVKISNYTSKYIAPDDATVCFVVRNTDDTTLSDLSVIEMFIDCEPFNNTFHLVQDGVAENVVNTVIENYVLVGASGTLTQNANYKTTGFIPVSPGDVLLISAVCGGNITDGNFTGMYGYDADQTLVGTLVDPDRAYGWESFGFVSGFTTYDHFKCVVPEGISYVRLSSRSTGAFVIDPSVYRLSVGGETKKVFASVGVESRVGDVVVGTLDANGAEYTSTTRLRTGFIGLKGATVFVHPNGQKVAYCLYDDEKGFLLNSGWKMNDYFIKQIGECQYVRFVVANMDDSAITEEGLLTDIVISDGLTGATENTKQIADGFIKTPYTGTVEMVMHRGYNSIAPENTIPAYKLARQMGFSTIETDVQLSSDNVPVILHDATVNRTSNGEGYVYEKTLAELKALDFGSWKSSMWSGTQIPTFEEMISCCKKIGLNVYIEVKKESPWTQALITECVNIVRRNGMTKNVAWISFSSTILQYVKTADATARLGFLLTTYTNAAVDTCVSLRTGSNEVMAVTRYDLLTQSVLDYMIENNVPLGAYLFDTNTDADAMQSYVTMALTNEFNAAGYIFRKNIGFS